MINIRKLVLDVLKPLEPDIIDFSSAIALANDGINIHVVVSELDKNTETLRITISGQGLDVNRIKCAIEEAGASLHSIDEVEVENVTPSITA